MNWSQKCSNSLWADVKNLTQRVIVLRIETLFILVLWDLNQLLNPFSATFAVLLIYTVTPLIMM